MQEKLHAADSPHLCTPKELAAILKVSPPTIMSLYRRGVIDADVAIDRVYRFDRDKCLAALRQRSVQKGGSHE